MAYQQFNTLTGFLVTSDNNDFYVYAPAAATFPIVFYNSTAEENRLNKTSYLEVVTTMNGSLKEQTSILTPSIVVQFNELPTFNYCYIAAFNRYYFVTGITSINNGLWRIDMDVDVLMSYKTGIGELEAIIGRSENYYNQWLVDDQLPVEKGANTRIVEIPANKFSNSLDASAHNFVLTVVGA